MVTLQSDHYDQSSTRLSPDAVITRRATVFPTLYLTSLEIAAGHGGLQHCHKRMALVHLSSCQILTVLSYIFHIKLIGVQVLGGQGFYKHCPAGSQDNEISLTADKAAVMAGS